MIRKSPRNKALAASAQGVLAAMLVMGATATCPTVLGAVPAEAAAISCGPGSVVVAESGSGGGGSGPGSVTCYPPGSTGDAAPTQSFSKLMSGPDALAFDSSGDLWVGNYESDKLVEYPKAQLSKANPVPAVVISAGAGNTPNEPASLIFDRSGDLWVANQGPSTVTEYSLAQLAKSGSPAPYKTISYSGSSPVAVRFDRSGDLWVSNTDNVLEFTKAGLVKADPAPSVVISLVSFSGYANDIAFDQQGNLWAANNAGSLVELTKAQLAHSGAPSPHVTIADLALSQPSGLALDSSGDLWTSEPSNAVVEFTKAQLAKSGSHIPARTISGPKTGLNIPNDVAIAP